MILNQVYTIKVIVVTLAKKDMQILYGDLKEEMEKIKDSNYYYGIEIIKYKTFEYEDVLYIKILAAKKLLRRLVRDENMEDKHRINDVIKAIKFNEKLL